MLQRLVLGNPGNWPNGQFTFSSGLSGGKGKLVIINESAYGLDLVTFSDTWQIPAEWARLLPIDDQGYAVTVQVVNQQAGTAGNISRVTVEIYEPDEPIYEQYPQSLIRNTNVLNTVSTGTSVTQTQSVVYDQSAINGETAGTVTSTAAAGGEAGTVDVTDSNPTGGEWNIAMQSGTVVIDKDASVTAPAFHGPADSAAQATAIAATNLLNVADTWGFPKDTGNGGKAIRAGSTFNGTGAGTYAHNMPGNQTPFYVGVTSNQLNSTQTVGVDTVTSTTVHVNMPNAWPFYGFAVKW